MAIENKRLKTFLKKEMRTYLINSRRKAGLSIRVASKKIGYASTNNLRIYERNGNIPTSEMMKIFDTYKIPQNESSKFLMELQIGAYKIRTSAPNN